MASRFLFHRLHTRIARGAILIGFVASLTLPVAVGAAYPPGPTVREFPPGPSVAAYPPGPTVAEFPPGPTVAAFSADRS